MPKDYFLRYIRKMSFVSYVLKHKRQDSALGDVAREIINDTDINRRWGYRSLMNHLETNRNPCDAVINILGSANDAFKVAQAVKRLTNLGIITN